MKTGAIQKALAVLLLLGIGGRASGQDALAKAREDLAEATSQYKELTSRITKEEGDLILEVQKLDDRILELTRSLRELESEEDLATGKQRRLDLELSARETEFDYILGTLGTYGLSLSNRLHVAETQLHEERLGEIERTIEGAGDDLVRKLDAHLERAMIGAERLPEVAGGFLFDGEAAGPDNELKEGRFALLGPVGFFASSDGELAGITSFTAGDVAVPTILPMTAAGAKESVGKLVETGSAKVPVDASLGKAFRLAEAEKTLGEFLKAGGPVGFAILVLGALAALLAVFKLIEIMAFKVPSRRRVNEIIDELLRGKEDAAIRQAEGISGLAGRVIEAGARHFYAKRRIMEDALFEKMSAVQPRLDRFLPFLAVIAAAAPMAGLLGTVLGIMKTFDMMAQFGTGDAKYFSAGIGEALITTFLGLTVAIPAIMVHGVLKSLSRTRLGQVEGIALAMLNGTTEIGAAGPVAEGEAGGDGGDDGEDFEDALIEPA